MFAGACADAKRVPVRMAQMKLPHAPWFIRRWVRDGAAEANRLRMKRIHLRW